MNTTEYTSCAETEVVRNQSMQHINNCNPDIIQDNADLIELQHRYEELKIPSTIRRIIDDYIACILSHQERMETLIYYAGFNNAQNG